MIVLRQNGSSLSLEREIARGGEGKIYTIRGDSRHVAKIFYKPSPEKDAKLRAMLANPPYDHTRNDRSKGPDSNKGHVSIAWPVERVLDQNDRCIGFIMPYIDRCESFPLLKLYNPRDRRELHFAFTWQYLLRMAKNLAIMIEELHKCGYVVGDLNESNILVNRRAQVTLIDCDSIQVPSKGTNPNSRKLFLCTVGKPEYTPPELQGEDFSQVVRKQYHDNFSLAILIFLMLMEGRHPFTGVWQGKGTPPTLEQCIKAGYFPYVSSHLLTIEPQKEVARKRASTRFGQVLSDLSFWLCWIVPFLLSGLRRMVFFLLFFLLDLFLLHSLADRLQESVARPLVTVPKFALPFDTLHPEVQFLMKKCFVTYHHPTALLRWPRRPSANAWHRALDDAEQFLQPCRKNSQHLYSQHLKACPWCERVQLGIPDPFPSASPTPVQRGLQYRIRHFTQRRHYYALLGKRSFAVVLIIALYFSEFWAWPLLSQWLPLQPWGALWYVMIFGPLVLLRLAYGKLLRA
jgi:DNA-binding helix-hairpin-helix protein with protein kinase domain